MTRMSSNGAKKVGHTRIITPNPLACEHAPQKYYGPNVMSDNIATLYGLINATKE